MDVFEKCTGPDNFPQFMHSIKIKQETSFSDTTSEIEFLKKLICWCETNSSVPTGYKSCKEAQLKNILHYSREFRVNYSQWNDTDVKRPSM